MPDRWHAAGNTIDDVVPILAGADCTPAAGNKTKVTCVAFKDGTGPNARFKRCFVNTGGGDNTLINQTSSGATGAPMLGLGNTGDDTLIGGDGVHDILRGSSGDDTLRSGNESSTRATRDVLEGGFGDDQLFGGDGSEDLEGGFDKLDGGDDSDKLDGGTNTDIIDGGVATSSGY